MSEWPVNASEVGFRSILQDEEEISGTEIVRKMMFLAGSVEEERCAQRTTDTCQHMTRLQYVRGSMATQDVKSCSDNIPSGVVFCADIVKVEL